MIIRDTNGEGGQFRVILVDDLNPEDAAMVQALKARSGETSEVVLSRIYAARRDALKEVLTDRLDALRSDVDDLDPALDGLMAVAAHDDASALARRINKDYVVGYGHKSIADCGAGTNLIVEGVSMLVAKALEHHPLYAGQETSTRAVDMASVRIVDPLGTTESAAILGESMGFYRRAWSAVSDKVRQRYPRRDGEDQALYDRAVKCRTFDVLRAWIPAGATTNVSLTMNLRQLGDHLGVLLLHPLAEVRAVAWVMQSMLRERYPSSGSFGGAAALSGVGLDGREQERAAWNSAAAQHRRGSTYQELRWSPDTDYDDNLCLVEAEDECASLLTTRPRGCVLPHWMADLGQVSCQFELDYGSFRDIHRNRNGVCRMPLLTGNLGFESWYVEQLPADLQDQAWEVARAVTLRANRLACDDVVRQYYLPMGCKVPVSVTYGLPAFVYVVEQRSSAAVHPTLRQAVLKHMVKPFREEHPHVKLHVDESEDPWSIRRGAQTIERKGG